MSVALLTALSDAGLRRPESTAYPERRAYPQDRTPGPLEARRRHDRPLHPRRDRRVSSAVSIKWSRHAGAVNWWNRAIYILIPASANIPSCIHTPSPHRGE